MHPAYSVIVFTTFSGAGYGLLVSITLFAFFKVVPPDRWFGFTTFFVAFAMITAGLLSSTFHLGHPERAWRALSQWKTSWLSREGVFAVAVYGPGLLFAFGWVVFESYDGFWRFMSGLTMVLSLGTVVCTAMIYASLRTIRAWFNPNTIRVFLGMSLWTGIVWFNMLTQLFDLHTPSIGIMVVIFGIAALWFKRKYWMFIDRSPSWVTPESATGLGDLGKVKLLDSPSTQETYIHQEMGYQIARTHAEKLRRWAFLAYFLFPFCATALTVEADSWIRISAAVLSVVSVMLGVMIERWLFFAEAKHTSMLYYGAETS